MFDRFTDDAKKAMSLARHEALSLRHEYIGCEHLLLGLLRLPSGGASQALRALGVDAGAARAAVLAAAPAGPAATTREQLPFTPSAKKSLEGAFVAAGGPLALTGNDGGIAIGSEHLLLGVALAGGAGARALLQAGCEQTALQRAVEALAAGHRDRSKVRALLISNSTMHGGGYLQHCAATIRDFLGDARRVLFVPYALRDHDGYAMKARAAFGALGCELRSAHEAADPIAAADEAQAVFVGGGNTFRLLKALYDTGLFGAIRRRALQGMPYVGSSAGTNVATLSIRTTNDMPIVMPPSFHALDLVPFQINPHYLDPDPASTHMGETREERLRQFHEENSAPALGLREGCMLRVEGAKATLLGTTNARLFRRGQPPVEFVPPCDLSFLLDPGYV
jgi:dipeptidase E